ncbi:hypothetical protein C461_04657 [Halorubrum aidingense JCM 13560]|uniref:Uncharacterized protein n=1 Tax=Halorubrum aidingense JCM 13560 TaxID=1230454 RepID=M0PFK9_9EURY|nr:hypothetical protein [Halorubrum aidingense]EMA68892.1 hypothetical protein C461_04657 [Halorubrum aidingense JCM 13560]
MGLGKYIDQMAWNEEHPAIKDTLDQMFDEQYPATLIQEELAEQLDGVSIDVESYEHLPYTPYEYDKTPKLARKWEAMLTEYMLCEHSRPDKRYQQSAARATEHLDCSAAESVKSGLTRETFYEPFKVSPDGSEEIISISAPSAELIRGILKEAERILRQEPDIIEQIQAHHRS